MSLTVEAKGPSVSGGQSNVVQFSPRDKEPDKSPQKFTLTFGANVQTKVFQRKDLSLDQLIAVLSDHREQPHKNGLGCVCGEFVGKQRKAVAVTRVSLLTYDIDTLDGLDEIDKTLEAAGVRAILFSTYSHGSTQTEIPTDSYLRWATRAGQPEEPTQESLLAFLPSINKGYLREIEFRGEKQHTANGLVYKIHHAPVTKVRVVFPLATPITMADLGKSTQQCVETYKSILAGVAQKFKLPYDVACSDPSRFFYLPSHPPGKEAGKDFFVWGYGSNDKLLDWTSVPRVEVNSATKASHGKSERPRGFWRIQDRDGRDIDLQRWVRQHGEDFDPEATLAAAAPDLLKTSRASGEGAHCVCPFEAEHTTPGGLGTFCAPGDGTRGFTICCNHNHCQDRDRLDFLRQLILDGHLTAEDIDYLDPAAEVKQEAEAAEEGAQAAVQQLTRESARADIEAVLPKLVPLPELARDELMRTLALNTGLKLKVLRDALKPLLAEAKAAAKKLEKAAAGASSPSAPNLDNALEDARRRRDYFEACRAALLGTNSSAEIERVRADAEQEGALDAFELGRRRAEMAGQFQKDLGAYGGRSGWPVSLTWDGRVIEEKRVGETVFENEVSSRLIVVGEAHNPDGAGACLLLMFTNTRGEWVELPVSRGDLTGNAAPLQSRLLDAGLRILNWKMLLNILQGIEPSRRFHRIERPGWCGEHFALPSGDVLTEGNTITTFQPVEGFTTGGTPEGVREMLAVLEGHPLFMFTVGVSLSAPLVRVFDIEPGGVHFWGDSSLGKTALLCVGGSSWGCGAPQRDGGIVEGWGGTLFASEECAASHNDSVLLRDEMHQGHPETVAQFMYAVSNGVARRAGRSDGTLRAIKTFCPTLLSTGETSVKDYMTANQKLFKAGQAVRVLDIHVEGAHGALARVPAGFESAGAAIDWIKLQSRTHYGHLGRTMMREFLRDRQGFLAETQVHFERMRAHLEKHGARSDPQVGRVASRTAFYGAVLMTVAARGLVPWSQPSVESAVTDIFCGWFAARGGEGSQEGLSAERSFTHFTYAHAARFDGAAGGMGRDFAPHNRLGLTQRHEGRREFWIGSDQALAEMLGAPERIAPFLKRLKAGLSEDWELVRGSDGRDKRDSPRSWGLPKRSYCIRSKVADEAPQSGATEDISDLSGLVPLKTRRTG